MKNNMYFFIFVVLCASFLFFLSGCASSVPEAKFTKAIDANYYITEKDNVEVLVDLNKGISMLESEKSRLNEKIRQKINDRKMSNRTAGSGKSYEVDLFVTRYDKGSAFARAMLAGLGQIHLDGDVTVLEMPARHPVGNFSISKTFAWGGIYGGTTNMEDIETIFADGVAAAVTGQKAEEAKPAE